MIDGSEKWNRQLAFELQNSHVCEKRSNINSVELSFIYTLFSIINDLVIGDRYSQNQLVEGVC